MARTTRARLTMGMTVAALALGAPLMLAAGTTPAAAQASGCEKVAGFLNERKSLVDRINKLGKQPKAADACALLGKLAGNGSETLKWAEANKDWCQIPQNFLDGLKEDHGRVTKVRGQACSVAAKQAQMEKQAREGGGLLGGGGGGDILTGPVRIPQGAL